MSHKWKIIKFSGTGAHIDVKKREITHNPKRSFIRLETVDLIHIYLYETGGSKNQSVSKSTKKEGLK